MSNVALDLLALLERLAALGPLPRVKRLHLPPPAADGTRDGEFCAIELDDGSLGLSFVLLGDTLARLRNADAQAQADAVAGMPALELARRYADAQGVQRTLGFAAVNALTRHLFDRAGYVPPPAQGSVGDLDLAPGDHVGMVGLFPPLVKQVLQTGARLTVIELREDLAGLHEGWRVSLDPADLGACNKVLSTSTVLLNDTLEVILAHCRSAQRVSLIGPGAGCLPDPLFARGVTLLGGSWIVDAEGFRQALASGVSWSPFARKVAIRRDDYPGAAALLERAAPRR